MLYKFLFPSKPDGAATSAILLIVRIIFGMLLMNHGIEKWSNYQELSAVFPIRWVWAVLFPLGDCRTR